LQAPGSAVDLQHALGGPVAAQLHDVTGSWLPVFGLVIGLDTLTAILALAALKPIRSAYLAKTV